MLLTDSVSVLAVDGDVIVSNFLLDVDTLFDEVPFVLLDSVLSSKLMSVAESFFELVVPVDSIVGFAFASPPEVDTSFGERVTVMFSAVVFPDWLMCFRLLCMVILPVLGVPLVSFVEIIADFVSRGSDVFSTIKSVPTNVVFSLRICDVENMVVTTDVVAGEFLPVDVFVPFLDVLAPADAVDVIFCCGLSEDDLIFVELSTLEILFDVLLEAGLPEDVVILPDTDAVVSNVVV